MRTGKADHIMLQRLRTTASTYPRQFWVIYAGRLIAATGGSMVWPFLTIYIYQKLHVPLTTVTALFTLNAVFGLFASFIAGPIADRVGRKGVMLLGMGVATLNYVGMSLANTLALWALLVVISGMFSPFFGVGADAMIADLIEPKKRPGAYALLRMANNVGVAIGPAIGGFIAMSSYAATMFVAAGADLIFFLLILFMMRETLPQRGSALTEIAKDGGYGPVLRDRRFLSYCAISAIALMPSVLFFMLLPVYAKANFGIPERQYGFIMSTNAAMVVFLQYLTTQISKRYPNLMMMALGAAFYALGVGSIALGRSFWAFEASVVILTIGEMIISPTGSTVTAGFAPPDMRGRYMAIFGLTWGAAFGLVPLLGGYLYDNVAPVAIWYSGLILGLIGAMGFVVLSRRIRPQSPATQDS